MRTEQCGAKGKQLSNVDVTIVLHSINRSSQLGSAGSMFSELAHETPG
jgi:hypothetical protein